jgi:ATP adenylyltransferase
MEYILGPKARGCVFCDKIAQGDDDAEHVLVRERTAFVTLNRYPYNNGHLLVVPYAHVPSLEDLPPDTLLELMLLVNRGMAALRDSMRPEGFNVGVNLGKVAGAGIASHVHIHIVPRWSADTSFMTTVGATRTIPETLAETYARLRAVIA